MVDTFNSFCNFARLKFQLSCGIAIGYLRHIQFLTLTTRLNMAKTHANRSMADWLMRQRRVRWLNGDVTG